MGLGGVGCGGVDEAPLLGQARVREEGRGGQEGPVPLTEVLIWGQALCWSS
jgi:hypothetical protein